MNYTLPPEVLSAIDEAGYEVVEVRQCTKADMVLNFRTMKCQVGQPVAPHEISSGLFPILRKKPSEVEALRQRITKSEAEVSRLTSVLNWIGWNPVAAETYKKHREERHAGLINECTTLRQRLKEVEAELDSWQRESDRLQSASLNLSPEVQAALDHAGCEATGEYRVTLRSDYGWLSPAGVVRLTCGVGTFAAEDCPRLILRKRSVPKSIACMEQDEHRNDLPAIAEPLVEYKPGEIP